LKNQLLEQKELEVQNGGKAISILKNGNANDADLLNEINNADDLQIEIPFTD